MSAELLAAAASRTPRKYVFTLQSFLQHIAYGGKLSASAALIFPLSARRTSLVCLSGLAPGSGSLMEAEV